MWKIYTEQQVVRSFLDQMRKGLSHHAYLLAGGPSTGKFTLLTYFAQILQCPDGGCLSCASCRSVSSGMHQDVAIYPDHNGEALTVEQVKGMVAYVQRSPVSPYRLVLVENIERLTLEASNALLKVLEEPPSHTLFLLSTSSFYTVLPTLVSRVVLLELPTLTADRVEEFLMSEFPDLSLEKKAHIRDLAGGRVGLAFALARDTERYLRFMYYVDQVHAIFSTPGTLPRFTLIEELMAQEEEIPIFLEVFTSTVRRLLLDAVARGEQGEVQRYMAYLEEKERFAEDFDLHVNKRLLLETFLLRL
jgi:hypothetical protein